MEMVVLCVVMLVTISMSAAEPLRFIGKHADCHGMRQVNTNHQTPHPSSGVYTIYPNGKHPKQVYCNHTETASYTIILRQQHGNENFQRPLNDYQLGFGSPQADYWIGLEALYQLTMLSGAKLHITLSNWQGARYQLVYSTFRVGPASQRYRLTIGGYSGGLHDDMSYQNGMYFTTYDQPDPNHCATHQRAGWWYNNCAFALLTGKHYAGGAYPPTGGFYDGVYWKDWMGFGYSLNYVEMGISRN